MRMRMISLVLGVFVMVVEILPPHELAVPPVSTDEREEV
jgi:hypothetical protein